MANQPPVNETRRHRESANAPNIGHPKVGLIGRALAGEHWFGDGPPRWANARTSSDAEAARERAVKRLRRFTADFPEADQLADILADCKPRRRCMSGACPECGRAFQRWLVAELGKLGEQP